MGVGSRWYCRTRRVRLGLRATAAILEPTAVKLTLAPVLVGASRVIEVAGEFSVAAHSCYGELQVTRHRQPGQSPGRGLLQNGRTAGHREFSVGAHSWSGELQVSWSAWGAPLAGGCSETAGQRGVVLGAWWVLAQHGVWLPRCAVMVRRQIACTGKQSEAGQAWHLLSGKLCCSIGSEKGLPFCCTQASRGPAYQGTAMTHKGLQNGARKQGNPLEMLASAGAALMRVMRSLKLEG